ncbi:hypothetical protein [Neisseria sicca]|jgi:hypothetical protein|uniref:hypothetical protein n=1 Tax=Neisseria sicca TaxID=490 RepID=UPI000D320A2D|nr:hypothetical protein [Neisseria sicca]MBF1286129.1 hypothetical protein [Neisseria sp.]
MNLEIRRDSINWHVKINDLKEIMSSLQREGNYWEGQVFLTKRKKEYNLSFRIFLNSNDEDEFDVTDGQLILSISDDTFSLLEEYTVMVSEYGTPFAHELNNLYFISLKKWLGCHIYVEND